MSPAVAPPAEPVSSEVAASNEPVSAAAVVPAGTPETKTEPAPAASAPAYEFKDADPAHAQELTALATEYKWTPEQASKFYARDVARAAAMQKAGYDEWNAKAAEGEAISRADPVIGGAKFDEVYGRAKLLIDKFQPEGMPSAWEGLVRLKLDKDPVLLRILHAIDEGQREPRSVVTGGATATAPKKSIGEIFYPDMKKKE